MFKSKQKEFMISFSELMNSIAYFSAVSYTHLTLPTNREVYKRQV